MTTRPLRIVFAGTPGFAAAHLDSLLSGPHDVIAAYTQPDRPAGRGRQARSSPVKTFAESHGIPVFQPAKLTREEGESLAGLDPDVMVVVAYGLILPEHVLQMPRFGCINVHASLLPRWRGAAPVERAILAGDSETGVSIMQMDAGLDTGDVLLQLRTPVSDDDNAGTVAERLTALGCQGLERVLTDLTGYQADARKQDDALATYAAKLGKEEAEIHWDQPAAVIQRQAQAFFPRSPAWCPFLDDRLRIIQARRRPGQTAPAPGTIVGFSVDAMTVACGEDFLEITRIQLPGKKPMAMKDVINGHPGLFAQGMSLAGPDQP